MDASPASYGQSSQRIRVQSDRIDMRNADWIVGLFMELADPTVEQRLEALSLFSAEIDHELKRPVLCWSSAGMVKA